MSNDEVIFILIFAIIGAIGFGLWMHSVGAGFFAFAMLTMIFRRLW